MANTAQRSFSSGELSPAMYARTDLQRYAIGLRTLRNATVLRTGGVQNRAGFQYLGATKYNTATRLVDAVFDTNVSYVLEFGVQYVRFWKNGALVRVPTPAAWVTATAYATGTVRSHNGTNYVCTQAHTSGSSTEPGIGASWGDYWYALDGDIYEWPTLYTATQLNDLQFAYQLNVVTIVHPAHPPATLTRTIDYDWTFANITFGAVAGLGIPTGLTGTINTTGLLPWEALNAWVTSTIYSVGRLVQSGGVAYECIFAHTSSATDQPGVGVNWPSYWILKGNAYDLNDLVTNGGVVYRCILGHLNANATTQPGVGASWTTYWAIKGTGGDNAGFWYVVTAVDANGNESNPSTPIKTDSSQNSLSPTWRTLNLSWTPATGAVEYRVYRSLASALNYRQLDSVGSFVAYDTDPSNAAYISTGGPPTSTNLFAAPGDYPSVVAAYQQRLLLGGTINKPDVVNASVTAQPFNFNFQEPLNDSDALSWRQVGRRLNRLRHFVEVAQRLFQFSDIGEAVIEGSPDGVLRPGEVNPRQFSENGAASYPSPLIVNDTALYVQARGAVVRDLAPSQFEGFTGSDLTLQAAHLVDGLRIVAWCYQQTPDSVVWAVRDDGALLSLTYVRELGILGWAKHDTDGLVKSVCCIPENNRDAVYAVVRRTINGFPEQYVERLENRLATSPVLMDAAVTVDANDVELVDVVISNGVVAGGTSTIQLAFDTTDAIVCPTIGDDISLTYSGDTVTWTCTGTLAGFVFESSDPDAATLATAAAFPTDVTIFAGNWAKVGDWSSVWVTHLIGKNVSAINGSTIVASPNNPVYSTMTVNAVGVVNLGVAITTTASVGLPYTTDVQTLDIDAVGTTVKDRGMQVGGVICWVEDTGRFYAGPTVPAGNTLAGLEAFVPTNDEGYATVDTVTGVAEVTLQATYNNSGRVLIRQVDPVPLTILSIAPTGFLNGGR
jgi:hypothetical protein